MSRVQIDLVQLSKLPFRELDVLKALVKLHAGQPMPQVITDLNLDQAIAQSIAGFLVNDGGRAILPRLFCESLGKSELDQTVHLVTMEMNQILGTQYKHEDVRPHIEQWYSHGYVDGNDYINVVKDRADAWRANPQLKTHLRPATLFGEKFLQYLNLSKISGMPVERVKFNDEFTGI